MSTPKDTPPLGNVTSWRAEKWNYNIHDPKIIHGEDMRRGFVVALSELDRIDAIAAHNATVERLNKALGLLEETLNARGENAAALHALDCEPYGTEKYGKLLKVVDGTSLRYCDAESAARAFLASLK